MLSAAVAAACRAMAPTWPLDRFIAFNPYWGRIDQPFETVSGTLVRLGRGRLSMPLSYYLEAWQRGEIRPEDLRQARSEIRPTMSERELLEALEEEEPAPLALPLLSDVLDASRDRSHEPVWRDAITQQITQFCAAYFDCDQADWHPDRRDGLYATWQRGMAHDRSVSLLMHAPELRPRVQELPADRDALYAWAVGRLAVPAHQYTELLQAVLLRMNGWAAWCAYLSLQGTDDSRIADLLAIRLAWECLIDDGERSPGSVWARWQHAWAEAPRADEGPLAGIPEIWQRAHEIAYQRALSASLVRQAPERPAPPVIQAVFCLDVRSERLRRALEAVEPGARTLGSAGFFGLPICYTPLGTDATWPRLPGLQAPAWTATDTCGQESADRLLASQRRARLHARAGWHPFHRLPGSAFTLVESLGLGYLGKLVQRSLTGGSKTALERLGLRATQADRLRPRVVGDGDRVGLAAGALRTMGLTEGFAPLVLLVGHASQSANNPHAASLDCGACGGQSGEVNARALADLLNDPEVRRALADAGIRIPEATHFAPAVHNTATDDVTIVDRDLVPAGHAADLARLDRALRQASERSRAERAPTLGLGHLVARPRKLAKALQARVHDWAQTRPEWGQADNAALIVAPRERTRGLDLQGRVFLHDYAPERDADGSVLERIMTGPLVVAHWINMQYFASTVDPVGYGSGNKVLHNVVGGRIGVFEGNGGDLRIGLSLQSVHDGHRWRHSPLRLSVFVEASQEAIAEVLTRHEGVRRLVDNRWIHLFRLGDGGVERYGGGQWQEGVSGL